MAKLQLSVTVLPGTHLTDFWGRARIGESLKRKPDNFYFSVSRNKAQEIFR
ncbi:hypothetical protein NOC27_1609 [Nitrosococcus oceani AFC27]|nr:hypothetical protein NOC27_1609 [Nitrosococcus oceani AFC27]